jgi:DNA-binding CsgD family transcriptional regulator/tetratricopeptide (TPR) repeat protein
VVTTPNSPLYQAPLLVGRERELGALRQHLDAALSGHGSLVLIGGEAGIGKTALADVVCRQATEQGALVLVGRCYDLMETPPYGPWVEVLDHLRALPDRSPTLRVVAVPSFTRSLSQKALFAQMRGFLAAIARERPLIVLLDDLHWADGASLDLLRFIARQVAASPILLVVTYRGDEIARGHRLYDLLPALIRETQAERIDLHPLGDDDVRALIDQTYHLPTEETHRLAAYLQQRAEGNPFFLGELLRTLQEITLVRTAAYGWTLGALEQIRVPTLLRQVIDARLARLGAEAEDILAVAAIIGQVVPLALWAQVGATSEAALLPLIQRGIESRVFDATADGLAVHFAHALIREALYESVLPPQRRVWHRELGEALLAQRGAPDPDAVAYHFSQAGDARAAQWLMRAGERAQRAFAWKTATMRFEAALALLTGDDTARNERGWLLFRLALLRRFEDPAGGAAYLEDAERMGSATADMALVAYAHFYRGMVRRMAGHFQQGTATTEEGIALLDALSPEDRARLAALDTTSDPLDAQNGRGDLTLALGVIGPYARAQALGERIIGLPSAQTVGSRGDAWYGLGFAYAALGQPEAARRAFARAREIFRADDHRSMVMTTLFDELVLVILPYQADRPDERQRVEAELWESFAGLDMVFDRRAARTAGVVSLVLEGSWSEVFAIVEQSGLQMLRLLSATLLAPLARNHGDADLAWTLVHSGLPDGPATAPDDSVGYIVPLRALAVALALDAGDCEAARRWLEALDRWLAWSGGVLGQADAHLGWAAYHRAMGDTAQARERATQALDAAGAPRQPLVLIAAHRLLGELDVAAGRLTDAERHFDAALTLADACDARYERALTLLALADLRRASGDIPAARTLLDSVRALCTPMRAAPALAQADALAARLERVKSSGAPHPAGLTAREVEVLRLVAAGLSNVKVAERLSLSPRTVNAHLTTIYTKLGVASRGAAIRFALDHDLR